MDRIYDKGVQLMSARDEVVHGGRELQELLDTLPGKMQKNVNRAGLRAGAAVFLAEVKQNIPVSSGDLRDSARVTSRARGSEVSASVKVGNKKAWYARLVEYGTKPHYIKVSDVDRGPGRGKGRRGTAARRETLASISTVNRRVLQIGANFVGPSVHHPGSNKKPFMRPAADSKLPEAIAAVTKKIRERLTKQGLNTPAPTPQDPVE